MSHILVSPDVRWRFSLRTPQYERLFRNALHMKSQDTYRAAASDFELAWLTHPTLQGKGRPANASGSGARRNVKPTRSLLFRTACRVVVRWSLAAGLIGLMAPDVLAHNGVSVPVPRVPNPPPMNANCTNCLSDFGSSVHLSVNSLVPRNCCVLTMICSFV